MGRKRPLELDANAKYELHQMLDELVRMVEVSNTDFHHQMDQLQADHRQRMKLLKQQIHVVREMIQRLRVPLPWWYPPIRAVHRLARWLQRESR